MIRRGMRLAGWLAIAAGCALPLFWFAPGLSRAMQLALGLFAILALIRPFDALMVFAGVGPVAGGLLPLTGSPYAGGSLMEAMILALLASGALRLAARRDPIEVTGFEWALLAFAALVGASCLVQWPVTALRAGHRDPLSLSSLALLRAYFERPADLAPVLQTVQFAEGIGLAALAARLVTPERGLLLACAAVAGAAGAAALNVQRLVEVALRQPPFVQALLLSLRTLRVSTQYGDLNAAGSYFSMATVMCVGLTRTSSSRRWFAMAILPVIFAGLWLSGSRVALAAAVLCGAGVLALDYRHRPLVVRRRGVMLLGAVLLVLGGAVAALFINPTEGRARFGYSVFARVELLKTGLRMLADHPLLGVGVSRFYTLFPRYSSAELRQAFATAAAVPVTHENAHNNLMQILAELGVAGLAAFILVLATAFRRPADGRLPAWRLAALSGLAAFLITCLAGHPLLTPMVAFPFWLTLGLAASGAPAMAAVRHTHLRRFAVATVVVLLATLPVRAGYERREADLDGVSIGFSKWQRDEAGNRFRSAGGRSTFFAAASSAFVKVPLRSPDSRQRRVQLRLDGRTVSEVLVPPGMWVETTLVLPRDLNGPAFRSIDVIVREDGVESAADPAILMGRPGEAPRQE